LTSLPFHGFVAQISWLKSAGLNQFSWGGKIGG